MNTRVSTAALDYAAGLIAAALHVESIARDPIGPVDGELDPIEGAQFVAALSEGPSVRGEYLMGSATPFEFQHNAAFEIIVLEGAGEEARRALRETLLMDAAAAIAADPTLGGLVDFAELCEPDPENAARYAGIAAQLEITYSAPTALG
jgi:hypothetical protein